MITIEEINQMTPSELKAAQRKLLKKIIVRRLVVPMAIIAAVHVAARAYEKHLENSMTDEN